MTADVVIRAEGLGKKYLIGHAASGGERYTALRDVLARSVRGLARSTRDMLSGRAIVAGDEIEEFWALDDVNFEIRRGEVVGIIGRNGAGKSTLLKVLSRITEPSRGRITIKGRVASLLEVGTGFHPELTGRENIYLNGAILGMTRAEIRRKFDEIVAFAEVERFLDTPVKRYSSGMYVRLAFAVAAHLEPEILIVDEVLAVGDAEFQKKCLGKMQDVAGHGRTILFVSHNLAAIQSLCQNALLLRSGSLVKEGSVESVLEEYATRHSSVSDFKRNLQDDCNGKPRFIAGNISDITIGGYDAGRSLFVDLRVHAPQAMNVEVAAWIRDQMGFTVGFAPIGSLLSQSPVALQEDVNEITLCIDVSRLAIGYYTLTLEITKPFAEIFDRYEDCLSFEIEARLFDGVMQPLKQEWQVGAVLFPATLASSRK